MTGITLKPLQRLRTICLAYPETSEVDSWGHPNFRAGKITFATLEVVDGRASIAFRIDPADAALLQKDPQFFTTPYGRGKWISLWAEGADWDLVAKLADDAYHLVALKRMVVAHLRDGPPCPRGWHGSGQDVGRTL